MFSTNGQITIPASHLGYSTNNMYPDFPPIMNDGRSVIASFQPTAVLNQDLINKNHIQSNWQYRQFMIKNGDKIRNEMFHNMANDIGYVKRPNDIIGENTMPQQYKNYNKEGTNVNTSNSDLKDWYLSREQHYAIRSIPVSIPIQNTVKPLETNTNNYSMYNK